MSFFPLLHPAYFICYLFSNTANGELEGTDNMESDDVQGNHGIAHAAPSKNGKYNTATGLLDDPFRLQQCTYSTGLSDSLFIQ